MVGMGVGGGYCLVNFGEKNLMLPSYQFFLASSEKKTNSHKNYLVGPYIHVFYAMLLTRCHRMIVISTFPAYIFCLSLII